MRPPITWKEQFQYLGKWRLAALAGVSVFALDQFVTKGRTTLKGFGFGAPESEQTKQRFYVPREQVQAAKDA